MDSKQTIIKCNAQTYATPPPFGAVLTVKHAGYWENGRLKDPVFMRERRDMSWDDIIKSQQS
jgi:hypothetical protein